MTELVPTIAAMTDNQLGQQNLLRRLMRKGSHLHAMTFNFHPKGLLRIQHLRLKRLWVAMGVLMVLGILCLSLIPVPKVVIQFLWSDKVLHGVVYAALMGWFGQIYRHDLARLLLAVGFTGLGIGIEYLQGMTPSRMFDIADMVANTCGVVLAWALSYTFLGTILERFEALFLKRPIAT